MTETTDLRVEAEGETVGEAKWAALRELERLAPGIDRESVQFQIVSEGERGLLGVGYTPAKVVALAQAHPEPPREQGGEVVVALAFVERVAAAIGANVTATARERGGVVTVTCTGPDLGLLIGKHGQTIDAIQYLANAVIRVEDAEVSVVVDAAGYRARRTAALQTVARNAARRAAGTGRRVELDPMTAIERRIVHESLKDDPEVETSSEGSEPNRYVVVFPRRLAG
ncbi:MAG TPA: RNA-binding cell elongation regulator Jag/EloR [Gaiellaceae bacterium]|nr:RNA-binding cell elongation regulator Jag/EloR [Gaiellaceae bacterium]